MESEVSKRTDLCFPLAVAMYIGLRTEMARQPRTHVIDKYNLVHLAK
jgi:hypothetical protein